MISVALLISLIIAANNLVLGDYEGLIRTPDVVAVNEFKSFNILVKKEVSIVGLIKLDEHGLLKYKSIIVETKSNFEEDILIVEDFKIKTKLFKKTMNDITFVNNKHKYSGVLKYYEDQSAWCYMLAEEMVKDLRLINGEKSVIEKKFYSQYSKKPIEDWTKFQSLVDLSLEQILSFQDFIDELKDNVLNFDQMNQQIDKETGTQNYLPIKLVDCLRYSFPKILVSKFDLNDLTRIEIEGKASWLKHNYLLK